MPETPTAGQALPADDPNGQLLLRALYDEQARLREELDRVRGQQQHLQDQLQQKGGDKQESDDEGRQADKQDQKKEGSKDKQQEGGDDKGDDKKEEKKKEPFLKRVSGWIKAHRVASVLIVIGFVGLLIAGYFLWQYLESYESTDDAQVDGHTDPISARISGFVVAAYVENTYRVKKGQVLVDLDPRDYEVALEQARANLSQAEAGVLAQKPNVPITQTSQSTALRLRSWMKQAPKQTSQPLSGITRLHSRT